MRRWSWRNWYWTAAVATVFTGCLLNPQPEPPGNTSGPSGNEPSYTGGSPSYSNGGGAFNTGAGGEGDTVPTVGGAAALGGGTAAASATGGMATSGYGGAPGSGGAASTGGRASGGATANGGWANAGGSDGGLDAGVGGAAPTNCGGDSGLVDPDASVTDAGCPANGVADGI